MQTPKEIVQQMIDAALSAADPAKAVREQLLKQPIAHERVFVVSAGKASVAMAQAACAILGERVVEGVVISKQDSANLPPHMQHFQGSHPVPDERSVIATRAVLRMLERTTESDFVLCLISGGASALLTDPLLSLAQWRELNDALLSCGGTINEVNHVRQHLDRVKGGGLLAHIAPSSSSTLILSDVIGDNVAHIGSGPTVPVERDIERCWAIFREFTVGEYLSGKTRQAIMVALDNVAKRPPSEQPSAVNGELSTSPVIIGGVRKSAEAAVHVANAAGYDTRIVSTELVGEAKEIGTRLAQKGVALKPMTCQIYGGETTVTLSAETVGIGGRNQELALAAAIALDGTPDVWIATLATDGEDGPNAGAGAIVNGETVAQAAALGLDSADYLRRHDSFSFFNQLQDNHLKIGSTGTNVNDLTFVLKS